MIHHTVTFLVIITLHLAFVTFAEDIYKTDDAIRIETVTTTDWQDQTSGTSYQQMAATENPENFTIMANTFHIELNVCLENLVSAFNTSIYVDNCSDLHEHLLAHKFQYFPYDCEFSQELKIKARKMWVEFNMLIKSALWFFCTNNPNVARDVIIMSRIYIHNFTEFIFRLSGSTEALGQSAVLDTVAHLNRTNIQHVDYVMELVEYVTEITSKTDKFNAEKKIVLQELEAVNTFHETSVLEIAVGKLKELVDLLHIISLKVSKMLKHTVGNPFINVIKSGWIWHFLDTQYWTEILEHENKLLVYYQTELYDVQHWQFLIYKVTPVIVAIVLAVGITGNGLLLTIFVRHKETRTFGNSMLINLTVVDFLSLVINVLLEYLRVLSLLQFGVLGCKFFFFFSTLFSAVSTYSVSMISLQRFVAVKELPSLAWCLRSQETKYVLIAIVWCIGIILSLPHAAATYDANDVCSLVSSGNAGTMHTIDLITICVVPLIIIAVFSGLTAYRIRRNVRRIPGEMTGQQRLKHNRMVSSNVLFALTVLFVVSYTPDLLFVFLDSMVGISITVREFYLITLITYYLRFVNCCLNPIVLFVLNKRFRDYIKRYSGQGEKQPIITVPGA